MDPRRIEPTAPVIGLVKKAVARTHDAPRSKWADMTEDNPGHSQWYVERFRAMAAAGTDLVGEARLIDAMAPRGARILDAGCGPGRHAGYLHRAGHTVVGVDLDPILVEAANQDEPGPTYLVGDLSTVVLPARTDEPFHLILCAGNVMTFLHPDTRVAVLEQFRAWLAPDGRAVVGFGLGRGYELADFRADVRAAGLAVSDEHASWDLEPFSPESTFCVMTLVPASA